MKHVKITLEAELYNKLVKRIDDWQFEVWTNWKEGLDTEKHWHEVLLVLWQVQGLPLPVTIDQLRAAWPVAEDKSV